MSVWLPEAAAILESALPAGAVDDALRLLHDAMPGCKINVLLADHQQTVLLPADLSAGSFPIDSTPAGHAFAAQRPATHHDSTASWLYLPISSRGDRLGVLCVETKTEVELPTEALGSFAALLGQSLLRLKSVTDTYERARRQRRMTVAAEMQWALLPGSSYSDATVQVAGMLEPAYSISGDAYDWMAAEGGFDVVVADGTGRGVQAALTTTLAISAIRNARMSGAGIRDQAALADQAVFAHHGGKAFVSALLMRFDFDSEKLTVVDAGSPFLFRLRGGVVNYLELEAQLPLGMFEETLYEVQEVELGAGDRFLIVSDGIHAARNAEGMHFHPEVSRMLKRSALLSPGETVRQVVRELQSHQGSDLDDDAVAVCVDWLPSQSTPSAS